MPAAALIPAAIGAAGAISGAVASNNASNKATNTARAGQQGFRDLAIPEIAPQQLNLGMLQSAGTLNPNLISQYNLGNSAYNNIQTDPRLKQAQLDALSTLQNIGQSGGNDAQAQSAMLQARQQNDTAARGQREAVLQNAAARGISGSGLELSSALQADQGAADRNAMAGTQAAADANQRKLAAIEGLGSLGSQVQGQEFGQQAQQAQANDLISRFNTANAQQVNQANVGAQNQAQAGNLANAQSISNQNVGLQNYQQQYNKGLQQQQYQNQLQRAQGAAGQGNVVANFQNQAGQNVAKALGGLGQTGFGVAGSVYGNQKPVDPYAQSFANAQDDFNK